jgi:IMP cyclohydrolase
MKKDQSVERENNVPGKAVLLIPEPENKIEAVPYGIKPGYYDPEQMLKLIDRHKSNADAIQFIADMLETGNPKDDAFAVMLRKNCFDANVIAKIVGIAQTK